MCKNAQGTASALFIAIIPTIKSLMAIAGVSADTQTQVIQTLNEISADIQNWKQGTTADNIIQALQDVSALLSGVIPPNYAVLLNVVIAGITAVIAVLKANSPAPISQLGAHPEAQAMHQADVAATASAKVTELVPGFKRSIFHSPESQYDKAWNGAVDEGGFPASLKV